MNDYGLEDFQFADSALRFVSESDIPAIIRLFRLNYGDDYLTPEVYEGEWIKRCIYNDAIICVVIEENGEVVACGTVILDFGDYNDQIGELARLVVHPERTGRGLGRRLINALFDAADYSVEFAVGQTRTANSFSQDMFERANFVGIGFLPQYYALIRRRESIVLYANLHDNGRSLRRENPPQIIPEIAPLARHVLSAMSLPATLSIIDGCLPYSSKTVCVVKPVDRNSLAKLSRVEHGRVIEPMLFGSVSLEQGFSFIRRRRARYLMAIDEKQNPIGTIGYQFDKVSSLLKAVELIAESDELRGYLCHAFMRVSEELAAQIVEVNVSAYDACLQQTFFELGFRPVAYAPAMVFHGTERLDVIKMLKLNLPYAPDGMELTESAKEIVSLVERGLK
jgi:N-acetylglutamate synthase-like GNAT family acetyltransferase